MRDVEEVPAAERVPPELLRKGCLVYRLRRSAAGFRQGDLLLVRPGVEPEGGELVVDGEGRLGRHGGGRVRGVVVGAVRRGSGS